jgi:hypothetical protein
MFDRILSALVALSLALLVWLYARSRDQEILDNVPIPVQVNLATNQADSYVVEMTGPTQILASFTGPPPRIRELRSILQRNELHVEVDLTVPEDQLSESRYSDTLHVEASDIHAPQGVTPLVVDGHNRIPVTLHRQIARRLPVRFDQVLEEAVGPVVLDPPSVLVRGPQEVLDKVRSIPTVPSLLPIRSPGVPPTVAPSARVALVAELDHRPIRATPAMVTVSVPAQVHRRYELADVPIQFLCPPSFQLRPQFIDERAGHTTLVVQGPAQDEPPRVVAFIDLTRGKFVSGLNHEPLQVQLPRDFSLVQEPPRAAFELVPADFVPGNQGAK